MRAFAYIYDNTYTNQLSGQIDLISASSERKLDAMGSASMVFPASDTDALALIKNERVIEVWVDPLRVDVWLFTAFVIKKHTYKDGQGGKVVEVSGGDLFELLKRYVTRPGELGEATTLENALEFYISPRTASPPLFTLSTSDSDIQTNTINFRVDGQNHYQVMRKLLIENDKHFRLATSGKTIEAGEFGDSNGLYIEAFEGGDLEIINNGSLVLLNALEVVSESNDIANWIIPTSGNGDTYQTIEDSTRGRGVSINAQQYIGTDLNIQQNAITILKDDTSISEWGQHELRLNANIKPISNSSADLVTAATALDDAAYAELQRRKQPQIAYKASVQKVDEKLQVGDKIRLIYTGTIYKESDTGGALVEQKKISDDFWILSLSESVGTGGEQIDLVISNIDRLPKSKIDLVVGAVEEIEIQSITPAQYTVVNNDRLSDLINPSIPGSFIFSISNATRKIQRILMRVRMNYMKSPVFSTDGTGNTGSAGAASGSTSSEFAVLSVDSASAGPFFTSQVDGTVGLHAHTYSLTSHNHGISQTSHSHTVSITAHTHPHTAQPLSFGVMSDTVGATNVGIFIDGVDYTTFLGGPFFTSGVPGLVEFEISDLLADPIQGLHTIAVTCTSGRAKIEVQLERYEVVSNVIVG